MSKLEPNVPERLAEHLAGSYRLRNLSANQWLFREGDSQTSLFIVQSGHIELSMNVPGRNAVPVLSVGAGELIAWSALLTKQPMTCGARAIDNSVLAEIPVQAIESLGDRDLDLARDFYQWIALGLSQRLTATRLQLLDLFQHPNA